MAHIIWNLMDDITSVKKCANALGYKQSESMDASH